MKHNKRARPAEVFPAVLLAEARRLADAYGWAIVPVCGKRPCVHAGGRVRYDPTDLRAWINARKEVRP